MWSRITGYSQETEEGPTTEVQQSTPLPEDVHEQLEQQQVLIEQLKSLVRENESQLGAKEKLLQESNAKFQKFKLQSKAKIVHLAKSKEASTPEKGSTEESESSNNDSLQGSPSTAESGARGKTLLLKKQLQESKLKFEQREKEIQGSRKHLETAVEKLQSELNERNRVIEQLKTDEKIASEYKQKEGEFTANKDVSELYAQIVYKDKKIMDLNDKILEAERRMMDLQENLREKDEVLSTRNKAIQLMSEDLSKKGKVAVDNLDETRSEMRQMQEVFAQAEDHWNQERTALKEIITTEKEKFTNELSEKEEKLMQAEESFKSLEQTRFELAARNAELQEKVVRVQENFQKWKESHQESVDEAMNRMKSDLLLRDNEIKSLKEKLELANNDVDSKILKARAKERSKLKALQKEMDELKNNNGNVGNGEDKIAELGKHIAELEEEKGSLLLKVMELEEQCKSEEKWTLERSIDQSGGLSETEIEKLKAEKDEMVERIATLTEEMDGAVKEKDALMKLNEDLALKLNETEAEFSKHRNLVNELETKMQSYGEHIKMLENNQHTLAEDIVQKEKAIQELQSALKVVQDDKVALELKIIEFEEQREADEKAKEVLDKEIKRLKQKIEDENVPVLAIEKEKEALEKELASLKNVESQQATRLSDFQNKISQLISETERLQDNHAISSEEMEKLEEEISYKCSEIDHKNGLLQAQSYRLDELEQALENSEDQIGNLSQKLEVKDKEILHLANREIDLENEKAHLEDSLHQSQIQTNELRETIKKTVESMENLLQQTLEQKQRELDELSDSIKVKDSSIENARLECNKLQRELDNAKESQSSEGAKIETKISSLLEQITELESELSSSQTKLNDQANQLENSSLSNRKLQNEIENLKASIINKTDEIEKLKTENLSLAESISEHKAAAAKHNIETELMNNQISSLQQETDQLNVEIKGRVDELNAANDRLITCLEELSSKEDEIKLLREEYQCSSSLNEKFKTLEEEVEAMRNKEKELGFENYQILEELQITKQNSVSQERETSSKIAMLEKELRDLTENRNNLLLEIEERDKNSARHQATITELQSKSSVVETECNRLENATLEFESSKAELVSKVELLSSELQSSNNKLSEIEKENNELKVQYEDEIKNFEYKYNILIQEHNASLSDKNAMHKFSTALCNHVSLIVTKINDMSSGEKQVYDELKNLDNETSSILTKLEIKLPLPVEASLDRNTEPSDLELPTNLEPNQIQYIESLANTFLELTHLAKSYNSIVTKLKSAQTVSQCFSNNIDELHSRLSSLEEQKQESVNGLTNQLEHLKVDLEKLKDENETLKLSLISSETNFEKRETDTKQELKSALEIASTLGEEKATLLMEKKALETNISTLEAALENCKSEMSLDVAQQHDLQLKLKQSEDRNLDLESKFGQVDDKRRELETNVERLKLFESEYRSCCEKLDHVQVANEQIVQDNELLNKTNQEFRISLESLESQLLELDNERAKACETLKQKIEELSTAETSLDQAKKKKHDIENSLLLLNKEKEIVSEQLLELTNKHEKIVAELTSINQDLVAKTNQLDVEIKEKNSICANFQSEFEQLRNEVVLMQRLNAETEESNKTMSNDIQRLSNEITILEREKSACLSQVELYQTQCLELQNGAEESVKNMSVDLESSRTRVLELQEQLQELESRNNQQQQRIDELQNSQAALSDVIVSLKKEIEINERANEEKESFNENIEKVLQVKTNEFQACIDNMGHLQGSNERLQNQVLSLSQELDKIQNFTLVLEGDLAKTNRELQTKESEIDLIQIERDHRVKELEEQVTLLKKELDVKNVEICNAETSRLVVKDEKPSADVKSLLSERNYFEKLSSDLQKQLEHNVEEKILLNSEKQELILNVNAAMFERDQLQSKFLDLEAEDIQAREEASITVKKVALLGMQRTESDTSNSNTEELIAQRNYFEKLSKDSQGKLKENEEKEKTMSSQLKDLTLKINEVLFERDTLQAKYLELQAQEIQIQEEESNKVKKVALLGSENEQSSGSNADLLAERNYFEQLSIDLQNQLKENEEKGKVLSSEIQELTLKINEALFERDTLQTKYLELEARVVESKETHIKAKKVTLLGNPTDTSVADSSFEYSNKESSELKSEIEKNKAKMGRMLMKLKQFKDKNDKLTSQIRELTESKSGTNTDEIENLKLQNIKLMKDVEEGDIVKERFRNLELLCENLNKEIQDLTDRRASEISVTQKEKEEANLELKNLYQEKMNLENQILSLKTELDTAITQKEEISNAYEAQNQMLKHELDLSFSEKDQLSMAVAAGRQQSEMLSSDNETYQQLIENLTQSKKNFETELQRQKEMHRKEIKEKENKMRASLDSLKRMEKDLLDKDHLIEKMNTELQQLIDKNQEIKSERDNLLREKQQFDADKSEFGLRINEFSSSGEKESLLHEMEALKQHYEARLHQESVRYNQRTEQAIHVQNVEAAPAIDVASLKTLEDKIVNLDQQISELRADKQFLTSEVSKLREINTEFAENRKQLDDIIHSQDEQLQSRSQQQRQLLQELNAAKQSLDSQRQIVQNLTAENADLRDKIVNAERHIHALTTDRSSIEKILNDVSREKLVLEENLKTASLSSYQHRNKQLEMELQQAMQMLHQQGVRCEELTMEISKMQDATRPATQAKLSVETSHQVLELQQRLEETESARQDLASSNQSLERDLERERERRNLVEEELTSVQAWQERMGLNSSKDEYHLLLEEEPQMIPETDFSISRRVLTNAYRAKRWLNGRRNYCVRLLRRSSRVQLVVYFYLFLIHVWLVTCLF